MKNRAGEIEIGNILKRVSLGFFDKNNTGEIAGAVTTDLSVYELYAMKMTDVIVGAYVHVAAMILCLLFFCWQAALIALAGVALSAFFLHLMSRSSHKMRWYIKGAEYIDYFGDRIYPGHCGGKGVWAGRCVRAGNQGCVQGTPENQYQNRA